MADNESKFQQFRERLPKKQDRGRRVPLLVGGGILLLGLIAGVVLATRPQLFEQRAAAPTSSPTPTPTPVGQVVTPTPTPTPIGRIVTATPVPTSPPITQPTLTSTPTPTPTLTSAPSATPSSTATPNPTVTPSPSPTSASAPSPTPLAEDLPESGITQVTLALAIFGLTLITAGVSLVL